MLQILLGYVVTHILGQAVAAIFNHPGRLHIPEDTHPVLESVRSASCTESRTISTFLGKCLL